MIRRAIRTMDEFALASGLSRPTVAKYFRDPDSVRPSTRKTIETFLRRFDYRPNLFAVNLNRDRARIVGVVIPSLTDPFYAEITRNIELRCIEAGYLAIVLSSHGAPDLETRAMDTLRSLKAAGIILAALGATSDMRALQRLAASTPIVHLDTLIDDAAPFVGTDNAQSISLIVDHLAARHDDPQQRPSFLDMPDVNRNAGERRAAYFAAMRRAKLQPELIPAARTGWDFEAIGRETARALIDTGKLPTRTILCANDRLAFGVLSAFCARRLRIGGRHGVRLAGHDDHPLSRFTCPALTTVAQDYDRLGNCAVDMLLDLIEGEAPAEPRRIRLPATLVVRASA